ncbi:hypothetical protein HZS_4678 [Henneguya salminicola]|nr:hypothetical protein HZS_4678 [Henneguya salminicola]
MGNICLGNSLTRCLFQPCLFHSDHINGLGLTVKMNESITKKRKYRVGRIPCRQDLWIVVGIGEHEKHHTGFERLSYIQKIVIRGQQFVLKTCAYTNIIKAIWRGL